MVHLFASIPNMKGDYNINNNLTNKAWKVVNQWNAFLKHKKLVRTMFLSIKGIYVGVKINNVNINYIVPHKFSRKLPESVD